MELAGDQLKALFHRRKPAPKSRSEKSGVGANTSSKGSLKGSQKGTQQGSQKGSQQEDDDDESDHSAGEEEGDEGDDRSHRSMGESNRQPAPSQIAQSNRSASSQIVQSNRSAPNQLRSQKSEKGPGPGPGPASQYDITSEVPPVPVTETAIGEYTLQKSIELTKEENEVVMGFLTIKGAKVPNRDPKGKGQGLTLTLTLS